MDVEMAVMNTESRIPVGFAPEDLGQAAIKTLVYSQPIPELGDLNPLVVSFALVSYLTSPITKDTLNQYVVFVVDQELASGVDTYQWEVYRGLDVGIAPIPISLTHTEEGVFEYRPTDIGEVIIIVRLKNSSGQELDAVEMRQTVIPFSEEFDEMVHDLSISIDRGWSEWKPNIKIGHAKFTNELANDFYQYIQDSMVQPIDGQPNQIPWQLLAAITYREMFFSPKESPTGTSWNKPNRTNEMSLYRNYLNGVSWGIIDVADWSLGICQIQPQTLATALTNPLTQSTYTPFREEDKAKKDGALQSEERLKAYLALPLENRIDLFNLLRFPKTHLRMCNIILQKLKNRPHRVPQLGDEQLLQDEEESIKGIKIIATEYNQGPTTTPWDTVGENAYGREVHTIVTSPMMESLPTLSNLVMELWGVVLGNNGAPLKDVRVDIYETWIMPGSNLKYWRRKEDFKDAAAPFARLTSGEVYRVLEINRNYVHGNQQLDLVKISVETALWDKNEGWIIAREGDTYYANLISQSGIEVAKTDNQGKFKVVYPEKAPIKLRFVKEANAKGEGFFDAESTWGKPPNYYKVIMEAADYMAKEADILALLPDWENYVYSAAWAANYPAAYYLGENNEDRRGYELDEVANQEIACNSFTQALITEAWFRKYPQLRWSLDNWRGFIIENVWDEANDTVGFDPFGPMTETLRGDGKITMAVLADISDNMPPPKWSLIQGWSTWAPTSADNERADDGTIAGHSFIIIDHQRSSDKILTLEANSAYSLNGVGMRSIGNINGQKVNGIITPKKDRLWLEKAVVTWQATKQTYSAHSDAGHNPNNKVNPVGIVRLKVYDLRWSGAEVL
jgi:hypothetical protein